MRIEDRMLLRLVVPLLLLGGIALSGAYYRYGPSPLFFALLLGVPLALILVARAIVVRRRAPATDTPALPIRAAIWLRRRCEETLASARRARRRARVRQVELAAAEAAREDERLSPEAVCTAAESLFRLVRRAWSARDRERLATLLTPELLAECHERLARGERSGLDEGLAIVGDVHVEFVSFGQSGARPHAVVLIEAVLGREASNRRRLCQYWTLALRDGLWTVAEIEGPGAGKRHLAEPIDQAATAG